MRCSVRLLMGAFVASAMLVAPARAAEPPAAVNGEAMPVRGVIRAIDQAALSTDLQARVMQIGFREGESFKKGDLLISFDCERYRAEAQSTHRRGCTRIPTRVRCCEAGRFGRSVAAPSA